jgi:hypothetical protein
MLRAAYRAVLRHSGASFPHQRQKPYLRVAEGSWLK